MGAPKASTRAATAEVAAATVPGGKGGGGGGRHSRLATLGGGPGRACCGTDAGPGAEGEAVVSEGVLASPGGGVGEAAAAC
jgi:hypothetical protein